MSVITKYVDLLRSTEERCAKIQEALGRIEARQNVGLAPMQIRESEFRVFSQWGEDGILQHLLRNVQINRRTFIEFGVESYLEANTRFLLVNDNWSGLVIDGSPRNIRSIKNDQVYWRHNLKVEEAFITRENINEIFRRNGIDGEVGLLSIDIDGNDYWILEAIDCISPSLLVIEYCSRFGAEEAVTIPYQADFQRTKAHFSNIYYGASLAALCLLAKRKGYAFVGCNGAGNNAFFVRSDLRPAAIPELTAQQGFVRALFREARDQSGALALLTDAQESALLESLPLVKVS